MEAELYQNQAKVLNFDFQKDVCEEERLSQMLETEGFNVEVVGSEILNGKKPFRLTLTDNGTLLIVIISKKKNLLMNVSRSIRKIFQTSFICIWHSEANEDPFFRQGCFGLTTEGANMVSCDLFALSSAAKLVKKSTSMKRGNLICPFCQLTGFSEDDLWCHSPLYHVNCLNFNEIDCPICHINFNENTIPYPVHLRNEHGPCGRGEIECEKSTGLFAIVVCQRLYDKKFLLVQEFANTGFWLPGGQLDAGESLREAVKRETYEEAGVEIELLGVLEVLSQSRGKWRRVVFYAQPLSESNESKSKEKQTNNSTSNTPPPSSSSTYPKSLPDYESTGACWASLEEVNRGRSQLTQVHRRSINHRDLISTNKQLRLRGSEPLQWLNYIENGGEIFPLEIPQEFKKLMSDVPF